MATVGNPNPTTPFTSPAHAKTPAMARMTMGDSNAKGELMRGTQGINRVLSRLGLRGFRTPCAVGRDCDAGHNEQHARDLRDARLLPEH